ncbi:hypothetical protein HMPREF9597_00757 [Cutibacterium acnes HL005PA4]|nr:hypothetical protein HMPREF9597_00757 [Cutibacterium acnes HL005PA4]
MYCLQLSERTGFTSVIAAGGPSSRVTEGRAHRILRVPAVPPSLHDVNDVGLSVSRSLLVLLRRCMHSPVLPATPG